MTDPQGFISDDMDFASAEEKELLAQVDLDVQGWRPAPGDKIVGRVVDITEATSEYGPYPLVVLQTPAQRLVGIHAFHTVLKNDIERRLQRGTLGIGWTLSVKYIGQGIKKGERDAPEMYRTSVRPPSES